MNAYKYVELAKRILRTEKFYDWKNFYFSQKILYTTLEIAMLPYFPANISKIYFRYENPLYELNTNDLYEQLIDKETNIYIEYFEKILNDGKFEKIDCVMITIPTYSQLISGLTLAMK